MTAHRKEGHIFARLELEPHGLKIGLRAPGRPHRDSRSDSQSANGHAEPYATGAARTIRCNRRRSIRYVINQRHHITDVPLTLLRILLETTNDERIEVAGDGDRRMAGGRLWDRMDMGGADLDHSASHERRTAGEEEVRDATDCVNIRRGADRMGREDGFG